MNRLSTYGSNYGAGYGSGYGSDYSSYGSGYGSSFGSGYGSSSYGSGYGSSYGSGYGSGFGSGYGSSYGSSLYGGGYGRSNYGGYNSGYGGGYGGYGNRQMQPMGPGGPQEGPPQTGVVHNVFSFINGLQNITDLFAQFAGLLNANSEAAHLSFSTFIGLLEGLSHLGHILSGFTALSIFRKMFNWIFGRTSTITKAQTGAGSALAKEFKTTSQRRSYRWPILLALLGLTTIATPFLIALFNKFLQALAEERAAEAANAEALVMKPFPAQVLYDYRPQRPDELELTRGDYIIVFGKPLEGWWEGEMGSGRSKGRRGLFPANYVQQTELGSGKEKESPKKIREPETIKKLLPQAEKPTSA